ncbi:mannose-6-phosphate isomerase, type 1 [Allosphingosinicella indica]|uniref:Mannose-6-phosphate isomerase, type 1 n=1 Tax=Allosphingosinicella indica TaxID=941907 RepID=A0A1X7G1N5_9SPHN|nr:mannose-6-phosphate isomerase, type 1 [Allosphingosinicella indica]
MSATARQLQPRATERVWGCSTLPAPFAALAASDRPTGEIWFDPPPGALLVKHLFAAEKLSVQVHPGDAYAQALGHAGGKDEAWIITNAEPGAAIGLGLRRPLDAEALRNAALDGSIEQEIDWQPVQRGDVICVPAGTIHAIGPGVSLIEMQQPNDITYRLYDYGRGRDLHLEDALAVARREPFRNACPPRPSGPGRTVFSGLAFTLERLEGAQTLHVGGHSRPPLTLAVVAGAGRLDGVAIGAGEVWSIDAPAHLRLDSGADAILAYYPA